MKLLHIVPDDKFIDDAIDFFDSIRGITNEFVCLVKDEEIANYKFEYIKQRERVAVRSFSNSDSLWQNRAVDMFVFHSLSECMYGYVLSIPNDKKIFWSSWGFDIYTASWGIKPILSLDIYKPITKKCLDALYNPSISLTTALKRYVKYCINYKGYRDRKIKEKQAIKKWLSYRQQVIVRIDYMSTVLPVEYDMLAKIEGFHAKYVPFQYSSRSVDYTHFQHSTLGTYILLGNSADFSNNHLDVLKILRERSIKNIVYMPLAYGDGDCQKCIKAHIQPGDNVIIQDMFISRDSYMDVLRQCRVAIFGHIRQQAMGNIGIAMQYGMKIYLYKESVCYKYFKSNGFVVYSIEDDLSQESIEQGMDINDIKSNVEKINYLYSFNNVLGRVQDFFSLEF